MVQIKLPDGSVKEYPEGVGPREVAEGIGKRLAEAAVAAVADGTVVDLDRPLETGRATPIELRILTSKDREALDVLRHSTAHIMARAIIRALPRRPARLRPDHRERLLLRRRPPRRRNLSEDDFPAIEAEMAKIIKDAEPFERFSLPAPRPASSSRTSASRSRSSTSTTSCTSTASSASTARASSSTSAAARTSPTPARSARSSCSRSPGPTGRARPTPRCSSASTAPPSSTRRTSTPTSPRSRRPRSATTACSARNSTCSPSRPLVGTGLILWMPKGAVVRGCSRPSSRTSCSSAATSRSTRRTSASSSSTRPAATIPITRTRSSPSCGCSTTPRWRSIGGLEKDELDDPVAEGPAGQGGHPRVDAGPLHDARRRGARRAVELLVARQGRADQVRRGARRERGIPAQADELPAPHPDLRRPAAQLPRPAGAAGRVRHGLPLRAVRRAQRA